MPSIRGTASVEDSRALQKALKSTTFPNSFLTKLDVTKVQRTVLSNWIDAKITEILGFEDEIVSSTAVNLFLPEVSNEEPKIIPVVDPKRNQIDLAGFLGDDNSKAFCAELWELLLDAQQQNSGIPTKILEAKKQQLAQQKQQQLIQQQHQQKQQDANYDRRNRVSSEDRKPRRVPPPEEYDRQRREARHRNPRPVSPPHRHDHNNNNHHTSDHRRPMTTYSRDDAHNNNYDYYYNDVERHRNKRTFSKRHDYGGDNKHDGDYHPDPHYDEYGRRRHDTDDDQDRKRRQKRKSRSRSRELR
jgi:serine/arginine repetitive matrix protein 1